MREVDFERNLGFLLGDVARLTRTAFDRRVASLDLTRSQWWVLAYVYRDQGLTQSELAYHLDVGKVALGNLIDRLEVKGWVERRPDQKDRRIKRIYLTAKAAPVLESMRVPAQEIYDMIVSGLTKKQQESLVDTLLVVRKNLITDSDSGK
jgi:DNA-binding MarR family transcriptional regulator